MKRNGLISFLILFFFIIPLFFCACSTSASDDGDQVFQSGEKDESFDLQSTVFIGDSNTYHLGTYGLIPQDRILTGSQGYLTLEPDLYRKYVLCPASQTLMTIADALKLYSPRCIIISLGTNGASQLDKGGFRLSYVQLIDSIRNVLPNAHIIVQSIPPVCRGSVDVKFPSPTETNAAFRKANLWLSELARDHDLKYLDIHSLLIDENGLLRSEYNSEHLDGYHLNRDALSAVLEYIGAHAYD